MARKSSSRRARSPKMTSSKRKRMAPKSFGLPKQRKYPLDTIGRARSALSRVSQHGSSSEQRQVRAAVKRKYPSIRVGGK